MKSSSVIAGDMSVVLFFLRIITAMETGDLYYTRTLHTLFLRMIEILYEICLSLSSYYGFKFSSDRVQFVHASLLYRRYYPTAGFISVSQYTAQQREASVKKYSKFSESTFASLPASGISW